MTNSVTINIGYYPGDTQNVSYDSNTGKDYYEDKDSGIRIFLVNESPGDIPGYYKLTHTPENVGTKSIMHKEQPTTGFEYADLSQCKAVTLYYWKADSQFQHPLLLMLDNGSRYYATGNNINWYDSTEHFNGYSFLEILDGMNCARNKAHQINISQKLQYTCSTTCDTLILVTPDTKIGTSAKYVHTIYQDQGFRVGSITHKGRRLKNIQIPSDPLSNVSVHYYSGDISLSIPFILEFHKQQEDQEGSDYEYFKNGDNGWEKISIKHAQQPPPPPPSLPPPAGARSPRVTSIQVGKANTGLQESTSESNTVRHPDEKHEEISELAVPPTSAGKGDGTEAANGIPGGGSAGSHGDTASLKPETRERAGTDSSEAKNSLVNKPGSQHIGDSSNIATSHGGNSRIEGGVERSGSGSTIRPANSDSGSIHTPISTQEGTKELIKILNGMINKHFTSKAGKIAGGVFGAGFGGYGLFETYALIFNKKLSLILKLVARLIVHL